MPLLDPLSIKSVLHEAKVLRTPKAGREELANLLDRTNLSSEEVLETISELMRGGDSSAVRLQAAKVGAELNGLLNEDERREAPVVNIIIHDSEFTLNPILIPR